METKDEIILAFNETKSRLYFILYNATCNHKYRNIIIAFIISLFNVSLMQYSMWNDVYYNYYLQMNGDDQHVFKIFIILLLPYLILIYTIINCILVYSLDVLLFLINMIRNETFQNEMREKYRHGIRKTKY